MKINQYPSQAVSTINSPVRYINFSKEITLSDFISEDDGVSNEVLSSFKQFILMLIKIYGDEHSKYHGEYLYRGKYRDVFKVVIEKIPTKKSNLFIDELDKYCDNNIRCAIFNDVFSSFEEIHGLKTPT